LAFENIFTIAYCLRWVALEDWFQLLHSNTLSGRRGLGLRLKQFNLIV
jgi:hypothetical protein